RRRERAAAGRAVQRPRRRDAARARGGAARVRRLRAGHQPRPVVPRPHRHPHPGVRGRVEGELLPGQLPRIRGRQGEAPRGRGRQAQAPPLQAAQEITAMPLRVAIPDMVSPSYFPAIAAVELGFFAKEGLDASIELIFPVTKTYEALREGRIAFVGGAAHAALYAFPDWRGCRLLCALSQNMYWFLVVRKDLGAKRGDLRALKGLRIGAAPGPVDGLKRMLAESGIDPEREVRIGPVPASAGAGVSFGVAAAEALRKGEVDGFWANGMAAELAVRGGYGALVVDARRGGGPPGSPHYTFPALGAPPETPGPAAGPAVP